MKMPLTKKFLLISGAALALAACDTYPKNTPQRTVVEDRAVSHVQTAPLKRESPNLAHKKVAIHFETGKSDISYESIDALKELVDGAPDKYEYEIIVESHADRHGADSLNEDLAQTRGYAIYDHLLKLNVRISRITLESFGNRRPAVTGDSDYADNANRRVDVTLIPLMP